MNRVLLWAFVLYCLPANAQIVFNEVAPTNKETYTDEDGDYPDWIELYNNGNSMVNLTGWKISDTGLPKWSFPAVELAPAERLIVFCSGKNRPAEVIPGSVQHWETAVFDTDTWKYNIPVTNFPAGWNATSFNDNSWPSGMGGIGYGDGDDNTTVPAGTISVLFRRTFNVVDKSKLIAAILSVDYDDGFVAYLNGIEIARAGISGIPDYTTTAADHEAVMFNGGDPTTFVVNTATFTNALVNGNNVLAISLHNVEAASSDLTMRPFLHFGISDASVFYSANPSWFNLGNGSGTELHTNFKLDIAEKVSLWNSSDILQDSISIGYLEPGDVRARISDGGGWCFSNTPTPAATNTGTCYNGYSTAPVFNPVPGFYTGNQSLSMTGTGTRYTTNGSYPVSNSTLYSNPVSVNSSRTIKARSFESGKLPSPMTVGSYFINEPTTLPVVAISAPPGDLFNGFGGPAVYDNAPYGGGLDPVLCHVEYFDAEKERQFWLPTGFQVAGNFSTDFPQKGIQFTNDEEFGSPDNIEYPLFEDDKPGISQYHAFRIRNTDDDYYDARMRDIVVNRMALKTHAIGAGYQNVAAFINGEYWGHYTARERLDAYFLRDNFGIDEDSVDIIKTAVSNYSAESGDMTAYNALVNFMTSNNMSNQANYDAALEQIDKENWIDYMATQIYFANTDWIPEFHNNIRCFKAYQPGSKWHYFLWDCAYSQSLNGSTCSNCNVLQQVINNNLNTDLGNMFNSLLDNTGFKNDFINRFADLMNEFYTTPKIHAMIDANAAEMLPEMDAHDDRWGTGNESEVINSINSLKNFHTQRPAYQRNHIQNSFNLTGQVNISLQANPVTGGLIKISTIIPENLPWTGVYFKGVPVTVTAIPQPGYVFVNWDPNPLITDTENPSFTANYTANTSFTANFVAGNVEDDIVFSELNYNSDSTISAGDWIELHNTSDIPLNIGGWILKDSQQINSYTIPEGTLIPEQGYLVIASNMVKFAEQFPGISNVIGPMGFDLNNNGEAIYLLTAAADTVISVVYDDITPWPQCADGRGRTLERYFPATDPNLPEAWFDGCMSGSPGTGYSPCEEHIIFNEINYKSPVDADAGDWIELYNNTNSVVNISGWKLTDQNDTPIYIFPANTSIPAEGYLVIYADLAKFEAIHPGILNKTGPFSFGLSGDGEVLRLYNGTGSIYLSMFYNDTAPWPLEADGLGPTLELSEPGLDLNLGSNWQASCGSGTPGTLNSVNGGSFPGLSVTGLTTVCLNGTYTYAAPVYANTIYNWTVTGGVIMSGQGTNTITVLWNDGVTGGVSLEVMGQ